MTLASKNKKRRPRRGLATLEFVMCLPLLVILWLVLVWVGAVFNEQTLVIAEARNKAWTGRDRVAQHPFDFDRDGTAEGSVQRRVAVSFLHADVHSSHAVLAGAWDHLAVPLDRQPHWDLYGRLGPSGLDMRIKNALGALGSLDGRVASLVAEGVGGELLNIQNILGSIQFNGGGLKNRIEDGRQEQERKDRLEADAGERKAKALRDRIKELEDQLAAIPEKLADVDRREDQERRRLGRDLKPDERKPFETERKELSERRDRITRELPSLREEFRRLDAEARRLREIADGPGKLGGSS